MIHFPPLRTRRLTVQLQELPIGESIQLAEMPGHLEEAGCTAFLRAAVKSVKGIQDPAHWTVQERMLAVCHYLAATVDDGPDFSLGEGRYSNYLEGESDIQVHEQAVELGSVEGDVWHIRHLTGAMAESIERLVGEIPKAPKGRGHWLVGAMAAQLVRSGESVPDADAGEGAFDEYLLERAKVFLGYPGSDFEKLMGLYLAGRDKLHHLFRIDFDEDGIVAMPKKGGVADTLPPARFPFHTCIPRVARELGGKPDVSGI